MFRKFFLKRIDPFSLNIKKQKLYLQSFREPESDLQRSFYQYKSQKFISSKNNYFFYNVFSLLFFPFLLFFYIIRPNRNKINNATNCAVFTYPTIGREIIPNELINRFELIHDTNFTWRGILELKDLGFIGYLFMRYPSNFYFVCKSIMKIAAYRYIIQKYSPRAFIVTSEYSFTSSVLTSFCERNNIEHINVMHGEKLYFIRDSFFRFTKCYVFDEHYVNLFCKMRADKKQFIISKPLALSIDFSKYSRDTEFYDFKYYLANYNEVQLANIMNTLMILTTSGYKVKVRPHPRYSDMILLNKYSDEIDIEDPRKIGIEESLSNTSNAIGVYTTVLFQGFMNGVNVVLDDVAFEDNIRALDSLDFILISKKHSLLSELISQCLK